MNPHIKILILNWNGIGVIEDCLDSVLKINYPNFSISVIDNGSIDNSISYIKQHYPEIDIIEKPDISIVDPPRAGLHPKALKNIIKLNQKKIIYISCNPSTQARDLKDFIASGYKVKNIIPVDMFPHTPHIESIVTLTK